MPNTKSQRGGPGRNQGRKSNQEKGLPKLTWKDYKNIRFPLPKNDREAAAIEWLENLEPFERMNLAVKIYYGGNGAAGGAGAGEAEVEGGERVRQMIILPAV